MKTALILILALAMIFTMTACKPQIMDGDGMVNEAEPCTLHVFAAASMTETLTELQEVWNHLYEPNIELVFTFDSSGTLKTQIEEGAVCDIFISAAQKQMNQLDELGLVDADSRVDLLENKCALVVPEGNPAGITSYEDLGTDKLARIALGNSDVPVGQYSEEILTYMPIRFSMKRDWLSWMDMDTPPERTVPSSSS
ncbi:MAG: molybdate ABC transporter substrate-binding protein, partial [Oscillospiraceae bacterium]|nr:molybdate ABC transporter substrate-binding protein [Oscillospiraceae bacterium]